MPRTPQNAIRLTDRSLRALKPGAALKEIMDLNLRGFGVRVFPSGRKTFFMRYTIPGGAERRFKVGNFEEMSLEAAYTRAKSLIGEIVQGADPQGEREKRRQGLTFRQLAESFLNASAATLKPRTLAEWDRIVRHDLLPAWGEMPAEAIRRRDVADLLQAIVARGAKTQANRTRAVAMSIFRHGVERQVVADNPVLPIRKPTKERSRQRVLSPDEIRALWAIWEEEGSQASVLYRMLLLTGQRWQVVATMRWEHISGEWWNLPGDLTKNHHPHSVYLVPRAVALLNATAKAGAEWVFPSPRVPGKPLGDLSTAKKRFREAAYRREHGLAEPLSKLAPGEEAALRAAVKKEQDWTPHDLRRTVATELGDMDVSEKVIALILGHHRGGVTAIYDRAKRLRQIRAAMLAWEHRLDEILRGEDQAGFEQLLDFPAPLANV